MHLFSALTTQDNYNIKINLFIRNLFLWQPKTKIKERSIETMRAHAHMRPDVVRLRDPSK